MERTWHRSTLFFGSWIAGAFACLLGWAMGYELGYVEGYEECRSTRSSPADVVVPAPAEIVRLFNSSRPVERQAE